MAKYHVNPDTGRVGVCKANKTPCKFVDGLHAEDKETAQRKYERIMMSQQFPTLKKEKAYEPQKISSVDEIEVGSSQKKSHDPRHPRKETNVYSENVWFKHNGENIGFVRIMRKKVYWNTDTQEIPEDKAKIDGIEGETDDYYTIMCDIEIRNPGMGHGRFVLEKLIERYGDIFISGSATPAGVAFNNKNLDLLHQSPADKRRNGDITSPNVKSSFNDMGFVDDWDNELPKFPL